MNVLIIPSCYGFGGYAGFGMSRAGVFFRRQAIALARHGARVTLLYVHFDRPSGVEVQEVDDEGVRCIYVHAAPLPLPINLIYKVLLGLWATQRRSAGRPSAVRPELTSESPRNGATNMQEGRR